MNKAKLKNIFEIKKNNKYLLFTICLKCAECFGFFSDGYQKCEDTTCPIFPHFPKPKEYASLIKTKSFKQLKSEAFSQGQENGQRIINRSI